MLNFNKDSFDFYLDYINKELYKSKRTLIKSYKLDKIAFINKLDRTNYWFPYNYGSWVVAKPEKLKKNSYFKKNSFYNHQGYTFLPSLAVFININFKINVLDTIQTASFSNYLNLLNEIVRKQELKLHTPPLREFMYLPWKYKIYSDYSSLKYYFNFSPHRDLARIRSLNFVFSTGWFFKKRRWVFTYKNMHTFYLRWRKTQKFEYKFFRFEGMSFRYWAKQQLQYNYFNINSSDFLSDTYNGNVFLTSQLAVTQTEVSLLFPSFRYNYMSFVFMYWLLYNSDFNKDHRGLPAYFSNSYNIHQVSNSVKHKYLKNFFSYNTPKYAHAYYNMLSEYYTGWRRLKNFFSLFKPSYWNLKKGLNLHPHEQLNWDLLMWWEDPITPFFSRFVNKRRNENFLDLDSLDSSSFNWFYRSWFHEEVLGEFQASYYKTYFNIDYLTPGWRIHTDFPKKRMGHFDPKWHERLNEYVVYKYMNIFYPSTKRYYIDYSLHPDYVDSDSFLVLNFAWKPSAFPLFLYKFPFKLRKNLRTSEQFSNPMDSFKPNFNSFLNSSKLNFFPFLIFNKKEIYNFFNKYNKSLIFLVNFFSKSDLSPDVDNYTCEYLFFYLSSFSSLNLNKEKFLTFLLNKNFKSYLELFNYVNELLFVTPAEWFFYKERVIAEYIAFKRFYLLLISEYENTK